eukprot:CAMPEP_0184866524 /NCGR_PEP_ID=MMETSP0580-20130426/22754_1 /TAXON_ID=1118495 /ORGANISM="Dactyliosolen fragilissimus" /LENGTH=586 /DNA_ID=CAMNT_0027366259 /DNA_START=70 /DNA_END=1830 /DNA_ORIENTATION=-
MTQSPIPRERGTLIETLPKSPIVVLVLVLLVCSGFGTVLVLFSDKTYIYDTLMDKQLALTFVKVALGSVSSMIAIIYPHPCAHSFAFGSAVLLFILIQILSGEASVITKKTNVIGAIISLAVSILFSSPHLKWVSNFVGGSIFINPYNCVVLSSAPFFYAIAGSSLNLLVEKSVINILILPYLIPGVASFVILCMHYLHHSHANGALQTKELGIASFLGLTMVASMLTWCDSIEKTIAILPLLLGATLTALMSAFFVFVAEVWYPVGTGQFHMISIDSAGIIFYFISPIIILTFRFADKYGDFVLGCWIHLVKFFISTANVEVSAHEDVIDGALSSLALFLVICTIIIIPTLNNTCPLSGHLFGKVYTHGQPNTKNIAICVMFSDLFKELTSTNDKEILWKKVKDFDGKKGTSPVLNIFVTSQDLEEHPTIIKELVKDGHCVGITSTSQACSKVVLETHKKYSEVIGKEPLWYHVGSNTRGRNPGCIRTCFKLGLRCALWSTKVNVIMTGFSDHQLKLISDDIIDKNGGSFVYVSNDNSIVGEGVVKGVCQILDKLAIINREHDENTKFSLQAMGSVAKEDIKLNL